MNKVKMVQAMIDKIQGGKPALIAILGYQNEAKFNNRMYQINGTLFFTVDELLAMQSASRTTAVADYFAMQADARVISNHTEEASDFDIYLTKMRAEKKAAELTLEIDRALQDGVITYSEAQKIIDKHSEQIKADTATINAIILTHKRGA